MSELKRKQAEYPYDDYWLYIILHKKENRYMANLIHKTNKTRTTISYAKYLMCVHLERILNRDEHVDHIDENKLNDVISNLQILTQKDNNIKHTIETGKSAKLYEFLCPICKSIFKRGARNSQWKVKLNKPIYCSRKCSGIASHIK